MAKDRFILLLSFAALGLLAAFLFRSPPQQVAIPETKGQQQVHEQITKKAVEVMVATKDLNTGDFFKPGDFRWQEMTEEALDPSYIVKDPKMEKWITRAIVAKDIENGSNVRRLDVIWPQEHEKVEKAPVIEAVQGKIGITYELKDRAAIASFMSPGLPVDIIFTSKPDFGFGTISFTLLRGVRVLSIGGSQKDWKEIYNKKEYIEILFEMSPREAEIFSYAQKMGEITLGLTQDGVVSEGDHQDLAEMLLRSNSRDNYASILITYMLRRQFPTANVTVTATTKGYIVAGKVRDPQIAAKIIEILQKLVFVLHDGKAAAGIQENPIVDLMEIDPQQVLICVKVLEVTRGATQSLGINWSVLYENAGYSTALAAIFPRPVPTDPNYVFSGVDVIAGKFTFNWIVDMLQRNGYAKVIAEPNLSTVSQKTAHFFAGGEFPILVPQGGTLAGTVTVEYRKFGVLLDFTPNVDVNGVITLQVAPEVSTIDRQNSVTIEGFDIPSLVVRRVETTVKLVHGQCYAIAGMIQYDNLKRVDHLYGLCRLPIIGPLFRSKRFVENQTELMIVITPYLVNDNPIGEPLNPFYPTPNCCNGY